MNCHILFSDFVQRTIESGLEPVVVKNRLSIVLGKLSFNNWFSISIQYT